MKFKLFNNQFYKENMSMRMFSNFSKLNQDSRPYKWKHTFQKDNKLDIWSKSCKINSIYSLINKLKRQYRTEEVGELKSQMIFFSRNKTFMLNSALYYHSKDLSFPHGDIFLKLYLTSKEYFVRNVQLRSSSS